MCRRLILKNSMSINRRKQQGNIYIILFQCHIFTYSDYIIGQSIINTNLNQMPFVIRLEISSMIDIRKKMIWRKRKRKLNYLTSK